MSSSLKINPEISVTNEKNEVKRQREQVQTMNNRVQMLRQQLQKEKDNVKKNKQLTKDAIQRKVQVNQINQWVSLLSSRKLETTLKKCRESTNSEDAINKSDLLMKKNFRIFKKLSILSNSMMQGNSSSSRISITGESSKWKEIFLLVSKIRKEKFMSNRSKLKRSICSFGRINFQEYIPNRHKTL